MAAHRHDFASRPSLYYLTMQFTQVGLAQMLKGGVIMDVTNAEEARIAEEVNESAASHAPFTSPIAF